MDGDPCDSPAGRDSKGTLVEVEKGPFVTDRVEGVLRLAMGTQERS